MRSYDAWTISDVESDMEKMRKGKSDRSFKG